MGIEEVAKDHHGLRLSVSVRFIGQTDLDIVVYVLGQLCGITRTESGNNVLQTLVYIERSKQYKKGRKPECKNSFHSYCFHPRKGEKCATVAVFSILSVKLNKT